MSDVHIFVIFDTMVFLKALGDIHPSAGALDCARRKGNRIALSQQIIREYKCKATAHGMTSFILMRKIRELQRLDRIKDVYRTQLEHAKSLIQEENLPLPTDAFDHKFFEAAIACRARYLVTTDPGSLALDPYDHNPINLRIVEPPRYTRENCEQSLA